MGAVRLIGRQALAMQRSGCGDPLGKGSRCGQRERAAHAVPDAADLLSGDGWLELQKIQETSGVLHHKLVVERAEKRHQPVSFRTLLERGCRIERFGWSRAIIEIGQ